MLYGLCYCSEDAVAYLKELIMISFVAPGCFIIYKKSKERSKKKKKKKVMIGKLHSVGISANVTWTVCRARASYE